MPNTGYTASVAQIFTNIYETNVTIFTATTKAGESPIRPPKSNSILIAFNMFKYGQIGKQKLQGNWASNVI